MEKIPKNEDAQSTIILIRKKMGGIGKKPMCLKKKALVKKESESQDTMIW